MQYWDLSTNDNYDAFLSHVGKMRLAGKKVTVCFQEAENHRTAKQSNCLHQWLREVAECLNANNLEVRQVVKEETVIDWSESMTKEILWRPVQEAITGEVSTTKPKTTDYPEIYQTLCRHFSQKHGVALPRWPDRFHDD